MSDRLAVAIIGSQLSTDSIPKYTQLSQINISTTVAFKKYFTTLPTGVFVLLLYISNFDPNHDDILVQTNKKKQIVATIICCDLLDRLIPNQTNVFHISKHLIRYHVNTTIYKFLKEESRRQLNDGDPRLGSALEEQRIEIAKWFPIHDEVPACHILIIPLNTGDRNLYAAQQRIQTICNELFGGAYNFRVFTLYDYIPRDESDPDVDLDSQHYTRFFEYKHTGNICKLIQRLSLNRMYLVGNEPEIPNKWSTKLIANELNINHEHASQYEDRCVFIEHDLVLESVKKNLARRFSRPWQIKTVMPKKLREIREDGEFNNFLERIYHCLENREMIANAELRERILESPKYITASSDNRIQSIEQAVRGPEEKEDLGEFLKKMLPNFAFNQL